MALHGESVGQPKGRKQAAERPPGNVDPELFARLKQLRLDIAGTEGVPAFVVFHDRSLQDMAEHKPRSLEQLAMCYGVGTAKLDRYGERFLDEIRAAAGT